MLEDVEQAISGVSAGSAASIVSIGRNGRGTGFVIATDRVLTSAHNVRDETVSVTFADDASEQGTVHGIDADGDLVVIAVPTKDVKPLELGDDLPGVGAAVVALSRGGHRPRATLGFVSSGDQSFRGPRGRVVRGSIEHTAPLARGSSGGPIFDLAGRVVGINTHRVGDGFYLARAVDSELRARLSELLEGRSPQRRLLGVAVAPPHLAAQMRQSVGLPEHDGLLVRGVEEASPAGRAGVTIGDLLVSLDDRALRSVDDLHDALENVGESAALALVRGVDELTVTVSFAQPA